MHTNKLSYISLQQNILCLQSSSSRNNMKRNCNLELQLVTPSAFCRSDYDIGEYHSMLHKKCESPNEKQLTVFYNGQIATCDATEIQAQAIIWLASREMEEKSDKWNRSDAFSTMLTGSTGYNNPTTGLSMKRSLQRFLQKRKIRAQETSPYHIARNSKK